MPALCVGPADELRSAWPSMTSVTSTMWES